MDLGQFRGKVTHGRVAIGPSYRDNDFNWRVAKPQIHVGHARTLVLASTICDELDIPLWLRVNAGKVRLKSQVAEHGYGPGDYPAGRVAHTMDVLFQAMSEAFEMLLWLGLPIEKVYQPEEPTAQHGMPSDVRGRVAEAAAMGGYIGDCQWQWFDDAWVNWPSLLIRGADWCAPKWAIGTEEFVRIEGLMFEALGRERYEINTPLLTVNSKKMGSGDLNSVSWRILQPMGMKGAVEFLMRGVDLENLPGPPTEWDWREWKGALE